MSGAVSLAGRATLRSGAGLVTLAVPDACLDTVAGFDPCYMTMPLPSREGHLGGSAREVLASAIDAATCVACGPGLGRSRAVEEFVAWLYTTATVPVVVDADGLNGLARRPAGLARPGGPRVLTPHPGEFQRLTGQAGTTERAREQARELAALQGVVLVLKGHRTFITDGSRSVLNETGNPGMASGGSGDVLTGVITALICQSLPPFDAACLAVHVHGLAGDLAAAARGEVGMIASDLIDHLPAAFQHVQRQPTSEGHPES
jgi:NAD(P)H-hydrate epimerase